MQQKRFDQRYYVSNKGFTIVELLIVVVVIAILATIVTVAYNGIRDKARQSANLAAVDQYEKAVYLYKVDNGTAPASYTQDDLDDLYANMDEYISVRDSTYEDIVAGTASSQPITYTERIPACLPGDYPAVGEFQEGECVVVKTVIDFNETGLPTITEGYVNTVIDDINSILAPKYLSAVPAVTPDEFSINLTLTNYPTAITLPGNTSGTPDATKLATVRQIQTYRGVQYWGGTGSSDVASISYYTQGDQSCGRGQKFLQTPGEMGTAYQQAVDAINDNGSSNPEYTPIQVDWANSGSGVWTKCQVVIR